MCTVAIELSGKKVVVLTKSSIPCIAYKKFPTQCFCELLYIDLLASSDSCFRIVGCYRPPSCNAEDTKLFLNIISGWSSVPQPSIIVGDFNAPQCVLSNTICEFLRLSSFENYVTQPTCNGHILDLVL